MKSGENILQWLLCPYLWLLPKALRAGYQQAQLHVPECFVVLRYVLVFGISCVVLLIGLDEDFHRPENALLSPVLNELVVLAEVSVVWP